MDRIAPEQAGALEKVVLSLASPHHHGPQAQAVTAVGFGDQNTCHQPANATESIQHHIDGRIDGLVG